jgi:hypothetical protein
MSRAENSVLFALSDLKRMETERVTEEALQEAEERHRRDLEAERIRVAEEQARRAADEKARLESAFVTASRRADALEGELTAMRRALETVATRPEPPAPIAPAPRHGPLVLAGLVAVAAIAAVFVLQRPPEVRERVVYTPAPVAVPAPPPVAAPAPIAPAVVVAPAIAPRPHHATAKKPATATPRPQLPPKDCNGDPMCGLGEDLR